MATTIDSSYLLTSTQNQPKKTGSSSLGKDDFLKILMTQLQNQDPLNPLQDKDFIAQMATFSTLEQMTNLGATMDKFVKQNQLLEASALIGKTVTYQNDQQQEQSARIKSVSVKDGNVLYQLDDADKTTVAAAQITKIE
ncbi:flagellar hook assembly protein FlgD [Neobacillus sp. SM06]|uniref:flagellar hook assembly protein FlgD n=1 Tax=Neobacillus sp. SM06 TaxID=3422492 RepID=UPI003D2B1857